MVIDAYQAYFGRGRRKRRSRAGFSKLYPSEVGACFRRVGYRLLGFEVTNPFPPKVRMAMRNGVVLEALTLDILRAEFGQVAGGDKQLWLGDERWSGYADFVVRHGTGFPILVEHKAVNAKWWDYRETLPYDDAVYQLAVYGVLYRRIYGIVPQLKLFYRGWTEMAEFDVVLEGEGGVTAVGRLVRDFGEEESRERHWPKSVEAVMSECERVWETVKETGELPERHAVPQEGECLFRGAPSCLYFDQCWGEVKSDLGG